MRKVRSCRRGAGTGGLSWAVLPVSPEYRVPGLECFGIECFGIDHSSSSTAIESAA
jgi:hypothetical protein